MNDSLILCINIFYTGSLIWIALFFFCTWLINKNLMLSGICIYCISSACLFYFRRIFPFPLSINPLTNSLAVIGTHLSIHFIVGSVLLVIFIFFDFQRDRKHFSLLLFFYILLSLILIVIFGLFAIIKNIDILKFYYFFLILYTAFGIALLISRLKQKLFERNWDKKVVRFIIALLIYYIVLAILNAFGRAIPYLFVIFCQCLLLFYFCKIIKEKIGSEFQQLLAMKNKKKFMNSQINSQDMMTDEIVQIGKIIGEGRMKDFCFTRREWNIIAMILQGHTNKMIGNNLYISKRTVDNHLYNIYRKANCQSRTELMSVMLIRN